MYLRSLSYKVIDMEVEKSMKSIQNDFDEIFAHSKKYFEI